jgi:D-alanyl-D-alanine carboxypeptidase
VKRILLAVAWIAVTACVPAGAPQVSTSPAPATTPPADPPQPTSTSTTAAPATTLEATSTTAAGRPPDWFLAWSSGSLDDGFAPAIATIRGVDASTVVGAGLAHLVSSAAADGGVIQTAPQRFVYPLDAFVVDPATYGRTIAPGSAAAIAGLGTDEVALGESSAMLRGVAVGDTLEFATGGSVRVGAVLPDVDVGAAEIVATTSGPGIVESVVPRFVVFHYEGSRQVLDATFDSLFDYPVRVVGRADTPYFRQGDNVLPQVAIKQRFGEFAYRPGAGERFTIDPAWLDENIVTVDLPLLGVTRCHRDVAELVTEAMERLETMGAADAIDPDAFAGCWNSRFIADRRGISRHAWGAAIDINIFNPLDGPGSPVDPALVEVMAGLGFTNGSGWLVPDPGHFEWYGDDPPR